MPLAEYRRPAACGLLALAAVLMPAGAVFAGLLLDAPEGGYPEIPTPPAPAFDADKTLSIPINVNSSIALGIDPSTITVGSDGVVRYVAVARSTAGSAVTAMYEGIRCASAEVKLYARHYPDSGWRPVAEPQWQSLYDSGPSRYSLPIARAGICRGASAGGSAPQIVLNLRKDLLYPTP